MREMRVLIYSVVFSVLLHAGLLSPLGKKPSSAQDPRFHSGSNSFQVTLTSRRQVPATKMAKEREAPREVENSPSTGAQKNQVIQEVTMKAQITPPPYPEESRLYGEEGEVKVKLLIDADGRVESFQILESSGFNRLDEAVTTQMKKTTFSAEAGGTLELSFKFELTSGLN